ncbi:biopolymer transporter ExbB [Yersinia intermedia]|uniref:biopolymer transporter ExbB n=1 Tax=Yersinia TaxID=629 RepID=UPI001CFE4F3D|nr:biopolymer transporter ExbB [Yersinia intermedia]EKN5088586.1 biopolymer transporter ExbB [Yersinia enterocolitica]MCB5324499.1 biopolymer transporter ExbB [Yersinia intermedia]
MSKYHRVAPAFIIFLLPYIPVICAYLMVRAWGGGIAFTDHRDALGGAMASYAGTTIAVLIAAMTFLVGIESRSISKVKSYGYMTSVVIMYGLTFVELGMIFFTGIFLIATSKSPLVMLPTISIGLAAASIMHLSIILIQLYNFSRKP